MPVALIWLVAALALVGVEALTGDLFMLMLAGGALAAAGSSAALDWPIWVDGLVFLVVSVLLLVVVRPALRRRFARTPAFVSGVEALAGASALVLEQVTADQGQVKIGGDVWTARPLHAADIFDPGDRVTVLHIDGATAVVCRTSH